MVIPWSALSAQTSGEGRWWGGCTGGLGDSSLGFAEISPALALAGHRHRLVDLPGYGRSAWTAEPYGLEAAATGLADWLDRSSSVR